MSQPIVTRDLLHVRHEEASVAAANLHYRRLNELVHEALARGARRLRLQGVNGQRYLADGLRGEDIEMQIDGVPGNDLAAFMDGPSVEVLGNAQDGIGNTMNAGRVVVHGDAGDVAGYGMRGGSIYIRGNAGYRVGIHMKEYAGSRPAIVVGGRVGAFLGEYMAGGLIIVLGLGAGSRPLVGDYCGTGMHGGVIAVRGRLDEEHMSPHVQARPAGEAEMAMLEPYLAEYTRLFDASPARLTADPYWLLCPASTRPYGNKYAL